MVLHKVFGVERDIDIDVNAFPTLTELEELEAPLGKHEHGWFDSCILLDNGVPAKLHYRCFLPTKSIIIGKKPKAIVIYLHGVVGHGGEGFQLSDGRKTNVALLAQVYQDVNQMAFYSFDLYGHGYSEGTRFFIPSWEENLQDYLNFIHMISTQHQPDNNIPIFLFGQSYGGNLTLHAARHIQQNPYLLLGESVASSTTSSSKNNNKRLAGLLLASPAIMGNLPPPPVYFCLRYILAPLYPKWTPFFMPNPIGAERVWKDEEMRTFRTTKRQLEMKLTGTGLSFRLGTALSLVKALDAVVTDIIPGLTVPIYLMHGTEDHGVPLEGSDFLRKTVASPPEDCVYDYIEGGYHDLLSVPESKSYLEKTLKWMDQRIKSLST